MIYCMNELLITLSLTTRHECTTKYCPKTLQDNLVDVGASCFAQKMLKNVGGENMV